MGFPYCCIAPPITDRARKRVWHRSWVVSNFCSFCRLLNSYQDTVYRSGVYRHYNKRRHGFVATSGYRSPNGENGGGPQTCSTCSSTVQVKIWPFLCIHTDCLARFLPATAQSSLIEITRSAHALRVLCGKLAARFMMSSTLNVFCFSVKA